MRKVAARSVAFTCTSRSSGKVTPKRSASVKASLVKPDHCLVIFPTFVSLSLVSTSKTTSLQQLIVRKGPEILSTVSPEAPLLTLNCGVQMDQSWWMEPSCWPLMLYTSSSWAFCLIEGGLLIRLFDKE